MNTYAWLPDFITRLRNAFVFVAEDVELSQVGDARMLELEHEDWGRAGQEAAAAGLRWAGGWGEQTDGEFLVNACLMHGGEALLLRTRVPQATPALPSHTPHFPAADRMERRTQDMLGIAFLDHPDTRRWARHHAWAENEYPLRKDFPAAGTRPGPMRTDHDYRFLQAQGAGVYEVPVGPIHAGIIEPGHFRFQAVGEHILHLEQRFGYVHKGIEKIAEGRDAAGAARLAGRVSGDSTVAFAWATCRAMEQAAGIEVPARALWLRAVMAERERIANHLGDIGAICNDVGFAFAQYQFSRLRENWQRDSAAAFGHRFMMDRVVPGGVAVDADADAVSRLAAGLQPLTREMRELVPILDENPSLEDRLVTTGFLGRDVAARLGATGYVGKASGQDYDARRDLRYAPYDRLEVKVPVYEDGDVATRLRVRAEEILLSIDLLERLLRELPGGPVAADWVAPPADAEGLAIVEGWRGEILCHVRFGDGGRIARLFPRDPSWFTWPALEQLIHGNIVPDFPVCNKSVNGSYSGHDL